MKLFNKSKLQGVSVTTLLLLCIGFAWQSSAMAKPPSASIDILFNEVTEAGTVPLVLDNGTEKLKLSKCCKPPKRGIEVQMSIPAVGDWQIDGINGELVGSWDLKGTPLDPSDDVFNADPIVGEYSRKNKRWHDLEFANGQAGRDEKAKLIALIEAWASEVASEEAGEEVLVYLDTKKMKLRLKTKGNKDGSYQIFLFFNLKLRRAESLGGSGNPSLGAGVYQIKVKGAPDAEAPELSEPENPIPPLPAT